MELPRAEPVTAQAFCQARRKPPPWIVRSLLHTAAKEFDAVHGKRFRWHSRHLLAPVVRGAECGAQTSSCGSAFPTAPTIRSAT
jgi:hypothetical protein